MAPKLDLFSAWRIRSATSCRPSTIRPFSTTPTSSASTVAQKRRHQDPYAQKQAQARKAANLSRQEVLRTERAKAYGDPVRGLTTPFVESFDTAKPVEDEATRNTDKEYLNYYLDKDELEKSLQHSNLLTTPIERESAGMQDPMKHEQKEEEHRQGHDNAREAISRITALNNSSGRDRTHANIQRCVETFGRHNTDQYMRPRPNLPNAEEIKENSSLDRRPFRAGADTGSSEVQIAILTAKIRNLANYLDTRGRKDKANQRNLRLLVHKRQKLMAYMRKKERGGERWQHLVQTLGLSDGMWRGEITM